MNRRSFLGRSARMAMLTAGVLVAPTTANPEPEPEREQLDETGAMRLFLCGDVMPGRGIDQVLPHSVGPVLHEPAVRDARRYVDLAEAASGEIDPPLSYREVWGDALGELARAEPHVRIVNLETAVTTRDDWQRDKGIHYRMHPGNVALLEVAGIDVCVLANNHVLDWGREGLLDTLAALHGANLHTAGAGADRRQASGPARVDTPAGRLLVFSYGTAGAGVPPAWAAGPDRAGVNLLSDVTPREADRVAAQVHPHRQPGDRVVVSLHWGGNWGYDVPDAQQRFARRLVDAGAADVIHGHSSHHPKAIEVYRGRPILYGAGDFLNDYEGIGGREAYRPELTLMYVPVLARDGSLLACELVPLRIRRFRLQRAGDSEARWLADRMTREGDSFGSRVRMKEDGRLRLDW